MALRNFPPIFGQPDTKLYLKAGAQLEGYKDIPFHEANNRNRFRSDFRRKQGALHNQYITYWVSNPYHTDRFHSRIAGSSMFAPPLSKTRTDTLGFSEIRAANVSPEVWQTVSQSQSLKADFGLRTPPPSNMIVNKADSRSMLGIGITHPRWYSRMISQQAPLL